MNLLDRCFTDFRLTIEHEQPVRYDGAKAVMEHLLKTANLPAAVVEEMRKLSGYNSRDLDKIRKDNAGIPLSPQINHRSSSVSAISLTKAQD